jgi:hypothetical protein
VTVGLIVWKTEFDFCVVGAVLLIIVYLEGLKLHVFNFWLFELIDRNTDYQQNDANYRYSAVEAA